MDLASCSERLVTVSFFRLTFCSNFFHAVQRLHKFVVNKHQPWLHETKTVQCLYKCHVLSSNNLPLYQVYLNLWDSGLDTSNFHPKTLPIVLWYQQQLDSFYYITHIPRRCLTWYPMLIFVCARVCTGRRNSHRWLYFWHIKMK